MKNQTTLSGLIFQKLFDTQTFKLKIETLMSHGTGSTLESGKNIKNEMSSKFTFFIEPHH